MPSQKFCEMCRLPIEVGQSWHYLTDVPPKKRVHDECDDKARDEARVKA